MRDLNDAVDGPLGDVLSGPPVTAPIALSAYDYTNQDPVNAYDLNGQSPRSPGYYGTFICAHDDCINHTSVREVAELASMGSGPGLLRHIGVRVATRVAPRIARVASPIAKKVVQKVVTAVRNRPTSIRDPRVQARLHKAAENMPAQRSKGLTEAAKNWAKVKGWLP